MFALRLGQSHGESICISTKIKIWRMQFLSAMPLFVTQFIIPFHIVIVNIICILKTHILASLFLKFLDTFMLSEVHHKTKSFKHLPIQQIINFSLYAKIRLFCIGAAHTASHRQKEKLPWLRLHARTVYASKFLLCMSDSNYLPYFRTITNTAIDRMASVATAPAAAALFPFFRLMIQPAPFITFRIPLFPNYMPFCSCMQTMVAHRRID